MQDVDLPGHGKSQIDRQFVRVKKRARILSVLARLYEVQGLIFGSFLFVVNALLS